MKHSRGAYGCSFRASSMEYVERLTSISYAGLLDGIVAFKIVREPNVCDYLGTIAPTCGNPQVTAYPHSDVVMVDVGKEVAGTSVLKSSTVVVAVTVINVGTCRS